MRKKFLMLLLLQGVAFSYLVGQASSRHFQKNELPTKSWIYKTDSTLIFAIILKDDGKALKVTDKNGKPLTVPYSQIEGFKKEISKVSPVGKGRFHYDDGFFGHYFSSINISGQAFTGVSQFTLGYKFKNRFSFGLGGGFDSYTDTFGQLIDKDYLFMSVYTYTRYDITDFRARFYLYNRLGWGLGLDGINDIGFEPNNNNRYNSGLSVSPGVGISFASKRKFRFIIELGMATQKVSGWYEDIDPFTNQPIRATYDSHLIRPTLKIGIEYQ